MINIKLLDCKKINQISMHSILKRGNKLEIVHKAFQPCLYIAQCTGIMPLYGISGNDSRNLVFNWKSFRFFLAAAMIMCDLGLLLFSLSYHGINSRTAGWIVFYSVTILSMMFFIILATKWKIIVTQWTFVNDILEIDGRETIKKVKIITILAIILCIGEHILSHINTYASIRRGHRDPLRGFFRRKYNLIFRITNYSLGKGMILLLIHFQLTIVWNFTDIFIINVAFALSLVLEHYNKRIAKSSKQANSTIYWKQKRVEYCQLARLVKEVDNKISNLVLISFGSNLFFICMQLYYSLSLDQPLLKELYFLFSFGFLLLRTSSVSFTASKIYEYSRKPMSIVHTVPSEYYNIEIQRLYDTVCTEKLALSGNNFFTLNRRFMVTIASTIFTYELVLIQFKSFYEDLKD